MPSTHLFSLEFHPRRQLQSNRSLVQRCFTDGEYKFGRKKNAAFSSSYLYQSVLLQHSTAGAWSLEWAAGVAEGKAVLLLAAVLAIAGWKHLWNWPVGALLVYADVCAGCHQNRPSHWLILALVFVRLQDQLAAKTDSAGNFFFFFFCELD